MAFDVDLQNVDDRMMFALDKLDRFLQEAIESFMRVSHLALDDFDGDQFVGMQVFGQFHFGVAAFADGFDDLILSI